MRRPSALLAALLAALATGCGPALDSRPDPPRTVTVTSVTDGDTVEVSPAVNGEEDVRLIGMDTPETFGSSGEQPYAQEATKFTEARLEGRRIELRFDVERKDYYGRVLAYVHLPGNRGSTFNETLVREGYAQVAIFPPNVRYVERLEEAQRQARAARRGIWGLSEAEQCSLTDRGNGLGGC